MNAILNIKLRILCITLLVMSIAVVFLYLVLELMMEEKLEIPLEEAHVYKHAEFENVSVRSDIVDPIILWWTPFTGEQGAVRQCGQHRCFFTQNRKFLDHRLTKVIMFYGSNLNSSDLPIPRNLNHDWALLHEESPKNTPVLSHGAFLTLFNHTATFRRESNIPLTLQYLDSLESLVEMKYYVPLNEKNKLLSKLAPVVYVQSDCNTPLERDEYVQELMKHIRVDSYGKCLHNKDLPKQLSDPIDGMDSEEFWHIMAQYKFTVSFENAVCQDYITEKLWRPLVVGSVPIYLGSPSVRDWLPNNESVIIASNFPSPKDLAKYIHELNTDDEKYSSYVQHKIGKEQDKISNSHLMSAMKDRPWGINNDFTKPNFVEYFECFVCKRVNSYLGDKRPLFTVTSDHYECPPPVSPLTWKENPENWWLDQWYQGKAEAEILREYVIQGKKFNTKTFYEEVFKKFKLYMMNYS